MTSTAHPASDPTATAGLPRTGRLRDTPLPVILLALHRQRLDGSLTLSCERGSKTFLLQAGAPAGVESTLRSESLVAQLQEHGLLDREQRAAVERKCEESGCREAVALLSLELIKPRALFGELKEQLRRSVIEAFAWPDGDYEIVSGGQETDASGSFRSDPLLLVHQGLRQYWTAEQILGDLTDRMQRFPTAHKDLPRTAARLDSVGGGAGLLLAFDGTRALGQLIGPSLNSIATLASLWIVDRLSLIRYADTPASPKGDGEHDFEAQIEIDVTSAADLEAHAAKRVQAESAAADRSLSSAAAAPASGRAAVDQASELRAQIAQLGQDLDAQDYYQLLGVESGAKAGPIKKAYFTAAKQYHPDTLARLGLESLKEEAARIFARIARAFEVLSDRRKRKDYDASLRGELTEAESAQLAQAEMSYRKAEILIRMGDFKAALEYLRPAVEIWPVEGEYQSGLGWALYKQPATDPHAAADHLAKAVELNPKDPVSHFRFGMVLRALGDESKARKHLDLAKQLDPEQS